MRYLSVFSGIEAASVAWGTLGWEPVAFSEVDDFPSAVLAERFPSVPNLGDITKVDWSPYRGAVDIVVGGSPCQSFSIAGSRTGLEGASGLMWEYVRCVRDVRPEWFVWENVPGALSSTHGEDFGCLLRSMDELGYGLAWRVLDAQFFGVAQRRRRVFLVGHLGDQRAADVLFESESLLWDSPSSREKREALASDAEGGARAAGFAWHQGSDAGSIGFETEQSPTITSVKPPAACYEEKKTPTSDPIGFAWNSGGNTGLSIGSTSPTVVASEPPAACYGIRPEQTPKVGEDVQPTLRAHASGGFDDCVAYTMQVRCGKPGSGKGALVQNDVSATLSTSNIQTLFQPVCMTDATSNAAVDVDMSETITAHAGKQTPIVASNYVVRKLTPTECERLQGFPDGWTDVNFRGKKAPDGRRYKALGNSMAVPVMRWIGERIEEVENVRP